MLKNFETIYISIKRTVPFMSQSSIACSVILCPFMPKDRSLWVSFLIPSIPPQNLLCRLKLAIYTRHKVHISCFCIETYLFRRHTPNGHILLQLPVFPCLCGTIESCRISVGYLKENSALQHLEIKIMMDAYQIVLANTSPNYSVFWVILTLSKLKKSIDKSYMYYSNKTFSGMLRGAGGRHV